MGRDENGRVDELLAALGYKVRSSDMADVALRFEQLEMAMESSAAASDDVLLSHLAFDAVHYNPSDLSTWVDNILSELNAPPPLPPPPPPPASLHCYFDLSTAVAEQTNTVNVGPAVCQGGSGDAYDLKPLPSPASSGRIVSVPEHQSDAQGEGSEAGEGAQAERGARGVRQATAENQRAAASPRAGKGSGVGVERWKGQQRHRELERAAASSSRGGKGSNI